MGQGTGSHRRELRGWLSLTCIRVRTHAEGWSSLTSASPMPGGTVTATADVNTDLDRTRFFIDGEWVEPRGTETHRALEAATGEPLGTAALATEADIDAAVKAARRALDTGPWGRTTAAERAEVMHRFAAALAA